MVDDISHEGLRELLHAEGVSFQAVKTWKASADPDYAAKKARVEHLHRRRERAAEKRAQATGTWLVRATCADTAGFLPMRWFCGACS